VITRRFAAKNKKIDWPILLKRLNNSGITYKEISDVSGITEGVLKNVANDWQNAPEQFNQAITLLNLYCMVMDANSKGGVHLPLIGGHNEVHRV